MFLGHIISKIPDLRNRNLQKNEKLVLVGSFFQINQVAID